MVSREKLIFFFNLLPAMAVLLSAGHAWAANHIKITPMIVVMEEYDDNLFLDHDNKKSDFITTASTKITINLDSGKNGLELEYSPTLVKYHEYSGNDTIRHNGNFNFWHRFNKYFKFTLKEDYLKSEDPLGETTDLEGNTQTVRHTRNIYQKNSASAGLDYQFGSKNHFIVEYGHELLINDDPSLDDATGQGPSGTLYFWFDGKNGIELNYQFTRVRYERKDGTPSGDNFYGHETGALYSHYFNPHTRIFISYDLTVRDFEDLEDYKVHNGLIGLDYGFSPHTTLSLGAGIYKPTGGLSEGSGFSFSARLNKKFKHGNISLGTSTGWDEGYLEIDKRGFTTNWGLDTTIDYQLKKDVRVHGGIAYLQNRDLENLEDGTYEGRCGIRWNFRRWYSLGMDYTIRSHASDNLDDEYMDNRIMMFLSASKMFKVFR